MKKLFPFYEKRLKKAPKAVLAKKGKKLLARCNYNFTCKTEDNKYLVQ